MSDVGSCRSCGKPIAAEDHFCESCGAALERGPATTPGATELASQLVEQMRTPAVATAAVAGGLAAAAVFAIGLLLGFVLSDQSLLGFADQGQGAVGAGFAQMLNFLQVGYSGGVGRIGPTLFVLFPIGACAATAYAQAGRTKGLAPGTRLASGAGVGLVFGVLMLVPALAAGSLASEAGEGAAADPSVAGALLLGILWGAIGGLAGTYAAMRGQPGPSIVVRGVPPWAGDLGRSAYVAVRSLVLLLAVMTVVSTFVWTVETLRKPSVRFGSSTLTATVDNAAYAIEHGVHWTELGALAQFHPVVGQAPIPVGDSSKIKTNGKGEYRIFGFAKAMPAYTFALVLIVVVGAMLAFALTAGFGVARLRRPDAPWKGAAWGALVGPVWAIAMIPVNALGEQSLFGRAVGDSVFTVLLLGGALVGAIGGLLGAQSPRTQATDALPAGRAS